jgi:hypothetical protein
MNDRPTLDQMTSDDLDALHERVAQLEDLLRVVHATSNASEAERARAAQRAETAERDARIYRGRLDRLTDGYAEQFSRIAATEGATARVRDLHRPVDYGTRICAECSGYYNGSCDNSPCRYEDCRTLAALDEPTPGPAATQTAEPDEFGLHHCPRCTDAVRDLQQHLTWCTEPDDVIALYEQWVKAGPPPLGTSIARWWDTKLIELHNAIRPGAEQPARTTPNNPTTSKDTP